MENLQAALNFPCKSAHLASEEFFFISRLWDLVQTPIPHPPQLSDELTNCPNIMTINITGSYLTDCCWGWGGGRFTSGFT